MGNRHSAEIDAHYAEIKSLKQQIKDTQADRANLRQQKEQLRQQTDDLKKGILDAWNSKCPHTVTCPVCRDRIQYLLSNIAGRASK